MLKIENMTQDFFDEVLAMMRVFYTSPAVITNGSEEIFRNDIEQCVSGSPYLEGYVFLDEQNVAGYGMVAKSFSTEFGKRCIWIEDIYLKPEYCCAGMGSRFLQFIEQKYADSILRIEVEADNQRAVHTYQKNGFGVLPYMEMKK